LALFLVFLLLGAGAVAVWIDARFPEIAPAELGGALVHVAVSIVLAQIGIPVAMNLGAGAESSILLALFTVAFPSLVYCLIAGLWVMRAAQRALGGLR
jgi:hypothetical protein